MGAAVRTAPGTARRTGRSAAEGSGRARPDTVLQALGTRRFLISAWPWRALLHAATTPLSALFFGVPLLVLTLPLYLPAFLVAEARDGLAAAPSAGTVPALLASGAVLMAVFGPLLALPAGRLERFRLRLVDGRDPGTGHRPPAEPGLWAWLRRRYTEAATWAELGLLVLTTALFAPLSLGLAMLGVVAAIMLSAPLLASEQVPLTIGPVQSETAAEAVPMMPVGVLMLVAVVYAAGGLAGAHGALARALLRDRGTAELRAELTEVTRSRARLVDAFESERRRIERDLHDGAQQRLVALSMQLGLARLDLPADSPAAQSVAEAQEQAKRAIAELRELIRGIHPQVLTDRGLAAALPELADRSPVPVEVAAVPDERFPDHIEGTAYFVVSEALANVAKHSGATRAEVAARREGGALVVDVTDDGRGGADPADGTGLTGLADRVAVMDGRMLLSSPPGGPTVLRVELPCQ
ncbi:sensor histidine kinase [Nocardiopsis composta]